MTRAPIGTQSYWNKWVEFNETRFTKMRENLNAPTGNLGYRPQYIFELAKTHWEQIVRRYSQGDLISGLSRYFQGLLDAWEESEREGHGVWTEAQQHRRNTWAVNLDHYIVCFWLVGLALALDIPDDQWQRLIVLIGNEGEDELLDRVIATRQTGRVIGNKLCHPKPYQRLLDSIKAPKEKQPELLAQFVSHWYVELDRPAKKGNAPATAMYERPYWYRYGLENFEGGAYFGRWCVEAVAVVKAFGLDDSLCLGLPDYPGDLLRPDGPSTHPLREEVEELAVAPDKKQKSGWLAKLLGKN